MGIPSRYRELRGRVALVTGASRRIGRGIALRLAHEGMRLLLSSRGGRALEEAAAAARAAGAEVLAVEADLADPSAAADLVDRAVERFGTIDLLVNNAADMRRVPFLETADMLDDQLAVNVRSPYLASLRAFAIMQPRRRGCIVHISSVGGLRAQGPGLPYDLTKGAIDAMTRAMALDGAPHGIRVNAVAPGATMSPEEQELPAMRRTVEERVPRIPLGRLGTPLDVAAAVAFLASDDASYITGQVLYVDGGITAQLHPPGQAI